MSKEIRQLIFIACLSSLLFACGGGGGGAGDPADDIPADDNAAAGNENSPGNDSTATATETLQVFIKTTTGTNTTYFPNIGESLQSRTEYIFRLLPDTQAASIFDKNYSPSYATSSISAYTIDDRLFIREDIRPFEPSGSHNYTEYGIDENDAAFDGSATVLKRFTINDPSGLVDGCWALSGEDYVYMNKRVYDSFYGYVGGDMRQITNVTNGFYGVGTSSEVRCFEDGGITTLYSEKGKFYRVIANISLVVIDGETKTQLRIELMNFLLNGRQGGYITNISLPGENYSTSSNLRHFAFDNGKFYFSLYRDTDGAIEIWEATRIPDETNKDTEPVKIYDAVTGFKPVYFDVDDGKIVVAGSGQSKFLLLDTINGTERIFDVGVKIYNIQVLFAKL